MNILAFLLPLLAALSPNNPAAVVDSAPMMLRVGSKMHAYVRSVHADGSVSMQPMPDPPCGTCYPAFTSSTTGTFSWGWWDAYMASSTNWHPGKCFLAIDGCQQAPPPEPVCASGVVIEVDIGTGYYGREFGGPLPITGYYASSASGNQCGGQDFWYMDIYSVGPPATFVQRIQVVATCTQCQ